MTTLANLAVSTLVLFNGREFIRRDSGYPTRVSQFDVATRFTSVESCIEWAKLFPTELDRFDLLQISLIRLEGESIDLGAALAREREFEEKRKALYQQYGKVLS